MHCAEYKDLLAAHMDGLLTAEEMPLADAHLAACPRCATLSKRQRRFRRVFRTHVRIKAAPAGLHERILAAIESESRVTDRARTTRWWAQPSYRLPLAGAAAAVVIAAVTLAVHWRQPETAADVLSTIVAHYHAIEAEQADLDLATAHADELRRYYAGSGAFNFSETVSDLSDLGYHLVGGSIVSLGSGRSTMTVYRGPRGPLLCHRFQAVALPLPNDAEVIDGTSFCTLDGITVAIRRQAEMMCIMASALPRAEFIQQMLGGNGIAATHAHLVTAAAANEPD